MPLEVPPCFFRVPWKTNSDNSMGDTVADSISPGLKWSRGDEKILRVLNICEPRYIRFQKEMNMDLHEAKAFLEKNTQELFYVGILKSRESWFPFCVVSDPELSMSLDTLPVSRTYQPLVEIVEDYAGRIPQIEVSFVHYMTRGEILDLIEEYGLKNIGLIDAGGDHCGCGCGCGCS